MDSFVTDCYGSREGGFVCHECREGKYHVIEPNYILELLREGEAAVPDEDGEVVLTHLDAWGMPFIRYRTGDVARAGDGGICQCGRTWQTIQNIKGRTTDFGVTPDGRWQHALSVIYVVRDIEGVDEFKIIQHQVDDIEVLVRMKMKSAEGACGWSFSAFFMTDRTGWIFFCTCLGAGRFAANKDRAVGFIGVFVPLIIVASISVPMIFGNRMQTRFSTVTEDSASRIGHWQNVLQAMDKNVFTSIIILLSPILGFQVVGLTDSPIDAPRVAFLYYMILMMSLTQGVAANADSIDYKYSCVSTDPFNICLYDRFVWFGTIFGRTN